MRGRNRMMKVSRTIAALNGDHLVLPRHLSKALQYRPPMGELAERSLQSESRLGETRTFFGVSYEPRLNRLRGHRGLICRHQNAQIKSAGGISNRGQMLDESIFISAED